MSAFRATFTCFGALNYVTGTITLGKNRKDSTKTNIKLLNLL
jgi:hypothetical protein